MSAFKTGGLHWPVMCENEGHSALAASLSSLHDQEHHPPTSPEAKRSNQDQMPKQRRCTILSRDYIDLDVYWNVKAFYQSAGYRVTLNKPRPNLDLVVVLRGDPDSSLVSYRGVVHVYDYVKQFKIDWKKFFPYASNTVVVSLSSAEFSEGIVTVEAYLPIMPQLWICKPFRKCNDRPLHISNFKSMRKDPFQSDLLQLAQHGLVRVFGNKWEQADIRTHGVSYWQANRLLAGAMSCFGLMYPYQRGITLSGRMWQAPLNGSFVVSEEGTNFINCPGVIEVKRFSLDTLLLVDSVRKCWQLQQDATRYWSEHSRYIATKLNLRTSLTISRHQYLHWKAEILLDHVLFLVKQKITKLKLALLPLPIYCLMRRNQRRCIALWTKLSLLAKN